MSHPSERFLAPMNITKGIPLETLIDSTLIGLIGESFLSVFPKFAIDSYVRSANLWLNSLRLKERARHIALVLLEHLPTDTEELSCIIIDSLGPKNIANKDLWLRTFFYFPHSFIISEGLIEDFDNWMRANYEVTSRFTAEFSIRPFLLRYPEQSIEVLKQWTQDPDSHVRRLVSEGTRPLLPWAERLPDYIRDPSDIFPLLSLLKNDEELYIRRSVANNLWDIAKHHLSKVLDYLAVWQKEMENMDETLRKNRGWIIRHALRLPLKKKDVEVLRFMGHYRQEL